MSQVYIYLLRLIKQFAQVNSFKCHCLRCLILFHLIVYLLCRLRKKNLNPGCGFNSVVAVCCVLCSGPQTYQAPLRRNSLRAAHRLSGWWPCWWPAAPAASLVSTSRRFWRRPSRVCGSGTYSWVSNHMCLWWKMLKVFSSSNVCDYIAVITAVHSICCCSMKISRVNLEKKCGCVYIALLFTMVMMIVK